MPNFAARDLKASEYMSRSPLRNLDGQKGIKLSRLFTEVLPALTSKNHKEVKRVLVGLEAIDEDCSIPTEFRIEIERAMKLLRAFHVTVGEIAKIKNTLTRIPDVLVEGSDEEREQLLKDLLELDQQDMYVALKDTVQRTVQILDCK